VLAQLACEVRVMRQVGRQVFRPVPNVDSVLVGLRRRGPAAPEAVRSLVHAAFAHRRKTLVGSVRQAMGPDSPDRQRIQGALRELGQPIDVRAERLAPEDFRRLAGLIAA
jgi:16S rRNA (adenine1518-N6/adenine1519-N6)-dimethyltransferase